MNNNNRIEESIEVDQTYVNPPPFDSRGGPKDQRGEEFVGYGEGISICYLLGSRFGKFFLLFSLYTRLSTL